MAHNKAFYLQNGKTFSSLKGLAKELKGMGDHVYHHHVNPIKNDFSNWVKHSLANDKLASKIDGHIVRIEMELEILRHLLLDNAKTHSKSTSVVKKAPVKKKAVVKKAAPKKVVKKAPAKKKVVKKVHSKKKSSKK